ncbi:MAG: hypothetical protein K6U89_16690 [Chloroflexi bacterium]|nr:hypothetical protein [Chloroflexota bacterium]
MQLTAILGIIIGFAGVIGGNILEGGNPLELLQVPAFVIVVVSSLGITMLANPGSNVAAAPRALLKLFRRPDNNPQSLMRPSPPWPKKRARKACSHLKVRRRRSLTASSRKASS